MTSSTKTVYFTFRAQGATSSLFQTTMTKLDSGVDGRVELTWPATGLDVDVGTYEGQIHISQLVDAVTTIHTALNVVKIRVLEEFGAVA